ncbi:DUF1501 domain-containing protein [Cyclobacterium plantarum]|uniref:DUF1501 domain-containing protein n=1 Tax=Cyclobacterium plantarum TaxID=2716263 RepID=A0ABX0H9F0_9BACT|nr:DUF1501 domain-containing protein [Cyclobacterium plantarum]NHE56851.1 DUF1501 domain-containing protein [Cyclobacterium plantarum]
MNIWEEAFIRKAQYNSRRHFLKKCTSGLGALALGSIMGCGEQHPGAKSGAGLAGKGPHFAPKAKSVIFLHMAGGPSHLELFDFKPTLQQLNGKDTPKSLMEGKEFAFLKGTPKLLGPQANFDRHGQSGTYVSDYMPEFAQMVDEVSLLKAMHTNEFNHAPAQLFMHTGSPRLGKPSIGAWSVYGLGSENKDLPGYVVLTSGGGAISAGKSAWGSGFLPTVYQGVQCRSEGDPVLFLSNPNSIDAPLRKKSIAAINKINEMEYQQSGDPEILTRISQYELAFRMQTSVPETMNINDEPDYIHQMYGTSPGKASFANNCLLARRLVEKGVRFIQLFDNRWDTHGVGAGNGVGDGMRRSCKAIDQPIAALLKDLKQRGLLEETLVVWGGEFGRTPMMEARTGVGFDGRDHHLEAFTMWMAGAGIKKGKVHGETDEIGYYGIEGRTHVHDLQATILERLGFDHEQLTYEFQGRNFRLTDVHGNVIKEILS